MTFTIQIQQMDHGAVVTVRQRKAADAMGEMVSRRAFTDLERMLTELRSLLERGGWDKT